MKKQILIAASAITLILASSFVANDCSTFEQFVKGTEYTTTTYSAQGKVISSVEGTVESVTAANGKTTATISAIAKNDTGAQTSTSKYDLVCDGTNFKMDMKAMASQQASAAPGAKGAEITIEADNLDYPVGMTVGQALPGGTVKMIMKQGGMASVTTINIKDRKCVAIESRTTPAGTFECYKITSTQEGTTKVATMSFPVPPRQSTEWFSYKVGSVRNEAYSDGKLEGYTELTKFKKGQ